MDQWVQHREYSSFLKEQKPGLIDKLRQPRLRLNHYVLMVESLQKKVTETEKSHLQEVIDLCKSYLTQADKALLLGSIKGCPFSLYDCGEFKIRCAEFTRFYILALDDL